MRSEQPFSDHNAASKLTAFRDQSILELMEPTLWLR